MQKNKTTLMGVLEVSHFHESLLDWSLYIDIYQDHFTVIYRQIILFLMYSPQKYQEMITQASFFFTVPIEFSG